MDNDLYQNALSAFNRGEYETAYKIISCSEESLSSESERLLNECKKQIAEQYYYIIKEYLQQSDYNTARREKEKYAETYGYNPKIESIEIPAKSMFSLSMEDSTEVYNGNTEQKLALKNIGLIVGIIAVILISIMIVVWQCTKNEDVMPTLQQAQQESVNSTTGATQQHTQSTSDIYEQRSNTIIQELTAKYGSKIQVDHKYPELSKYCTFRLKGEDDYGFPYLLIYDLDKEKLKQFNTEALPTNNAGEVLLINYDVLINQESNTLLISGNNGANSIGHIEYVLELNPSNWQIRELCSGRAITKNDDGYIAHRMVMTKFIDCNATSEYAFVDIHYDLQGRLIAPSYNGNTYYLKGQINNKYPITMQLSMQGDKIYGKYYYDKNGSDSCLHLYGGVSDSGDVVLLEFNNKGEQTGDFKGRFTSDSFYGTFVNYKGIEMPFELQKDNHNVVPQETTLKKYHNSRFGYNVLYPSSFSNIYESENGDGCRFSKDSHTCLIVYGMHNVLNETIEDKYNEYRSKSPVYYRLKDNWFVVSDYTENGDIFYLKTVLKDGVFITAELHYPNNEKEYYSKLISKIFINFPN